VNQTPVNQTPVNQTPVNQTPVNQSPTNNTQSNPVPVVTSTKPNVPDSGLVFSVQLGAYREVVPVAMANRFLQFASRGVSIYKDPNTGLTVYQVGSLNTYAEASQLRTEALNKGITDAFIVAWKDGRKISVEEALKIRPQ
jgi:N-acetylmuramoyl-L-alanine amidase